jgi:hypothetical protein
MVFKRATPITALDLDPSDFPDAVHLICTETITGAKSYEPDAAVLYGLRVYRSGVADDGKYHLYLSDDSANGTRLLGIDHRGAGDTQPFAIDVHNFPGRAIRHDHSSILGV